MCVFILKLKKVISSCVEHQKQGRKRPLDTPKRMIERRERRRERERKVEEREVKGIER